MKKLIYSVIGLLSIVLFFAFTEFGNHDPSFTEEFDVEGPVELALSTSGGSIEVKSSTDENKVMVDFHVFKGGKRINMSLSELREEKDVSIDQSGNEIKIKVSNKKNSSSKYSVAFVATVPRMTSTYVRTSGGHLKLHSLIGKQELKTSGGHIEIVDIKGHIEAKTSGGHIDSRDVQGIINVSTSGGNIAVNHFEGSLEAKTSGGNISLEHIKGNATAGTSGGNIEVSFMEIDGNSAFRTSGGNVSVNIPDEAGLDLELRGSYVDLGLDGVSGEKSKSSFVGTINGGGYVLKCGTSGGKVSVH